MNVPSPHVLLRASRFSVGGVRARGVPAILLGVAAIVLANAIGRTLERTVSIVPETLREAKELWLAVRGGRPPRLPP